MLKNSQTLPTFRRHEKVYTFHNIQKNLYTNNLKIQHDVQIQIQQEREGI